MFDEEMTFEEKLLVMDEDELRDLIFALLDANQSLADYNNQLINAIHEKDMLTYLADDGTVYID